MISRLNRYLITPYTIRLLPPLREQQEHH